jgi:hypothetical protein
VAAYQLCGQFADLMRVSENIIRYRTRQFFAALKPRVSDDDRQQLGAVFSGNSAALVLFERMRAADRQHALAVLKTLPPAETLNVPADAYLALQRAALLHDVGKTMGQPLLYRVVIVLLQVAWPAALQTLSQASLTCPAWRRPFVINARHPKIGAAWAREAGCRPLTVSLIEGHQGAPAGQPATLFEKLHRALYEADGKN